MAVRLKAKTWINGTTARLGQVQQALDAAAHVIEAKANVRLAAHRSFKDPLHHTIGVGKDKNVAYGSIDYLVYIEGPAPVSMELGHLDKKTKKKVEGLYILAKSAGLL